MSLGTTAHMHVREAMSSPVISVDENEDIVQVAFLLDVEIDEQVVNGHRQHQPEIQAEQEFFVIDVNQEVVLGWQPGLAIRGLGD